MLQESWQRCYYIAAVLALLSEAICNLQAGGIGRRCKACLAHSNGRPPSIVRDCLARSLLAMLIRSRRLGQSNPPYNYITPTANNMLFTRGDRPSRGESNKVQHPAEGLGREDNTAQSHSPASCWSLPPPEFQCLPPYMSRNIMLTHRHQSKSMIRRCGVCVCNLSITCRSAWHS